MLYIQGNMQCIVSQADPTFLTESLPAAQFGSVYNQTIQLASSTSEALTVTLVGSLNAESFEITTNCPSRPNEILVQGISQQQRP